MSAGSSTGVDGASFALARWGGVIAIVTSSAAATADVASRTWKNGSGCDDRRAGCV